MGLFSSYNPAHTEMIPMNSVERLINSEFCCNRFWFLLKCYLYIGVDSVHRKRVYGSGDKLAVGMRHRAWVPYTDQYGHRVLRGGEQAVLQNSGTGNSRWLSTLAQSMQLRRAGILGKGYPMICILLEISWRTFTSKHPRTNR